MGYLAGLPGKGKTFILMDGAKVNNLPQVIFREIETLFLRKSDIFGNTVAA